MSSDAKVTTELAKLHLKFSKMRRAVRAMRTEQKKKRKDPPTPAADSPPAKKARATLTDEELCLVTVANLHDVVPDAMVKQMCKEAGQLTTFRRAPYGAVAVCTYATPEEAAAAIAALDGQMLYGRGVRAYRTLDDARVPQPQEPPMPAKTSAPAKEADKDGRYVTIANLHRYVPDSSVKQICEDAGPVTNFVRAEHSPTALCEYATAEDGAKAIAALNGRQLFGNRVSAFPTIGQTSRKEPRVLFFLDLGTRKGLEFPPRVWCEVSASEFAWLEKTWKEPTYKDRFVHRGNYTVLGYPVTWDDVKCVYEEARDEKDYGVQHCFVVHDMGQTPYYPRHWFKHHEEEDDDE